MDTKYIVGIKISKTPKLKTYSNFVTDFSAYSVHFYLQINFVTLAQHIQYRLLTTHWSGNYRTLQFP